MELIMTSSRSGRDRMPTSIRKTVTTRGL